MDGEASAREPDGLDAAAAALAANGSDLDLLVHRLAEKLAAVPGLDPVVTYRQPRWRRLLGDLPSVNDLHRRSHPIARLAVRVGTSDDVLETTRSSLSCRVDGRSASGGRTSQGVPPLVL